MRLAIFDDLRLGVVARDGESIVDVTDRLPWPHDPDPVGAGWWIRLCRDFESLRDGLADGAAAGRPIPMADVRLRAPVLNPGKIVATAVNSGAHMQEMQAVIARNQMDTPAWMLRFDVFLKAPSSIIGPAEAIRLTPAHAGQEVHHEGELAVVIGAGGSGIRSDVALRHVLGYTVALDMTLRADGDRSRRKSYDTFTPLGPWLVTADEVGETAELRIHLRVGDEVREDFRVGDLDHDVAGIVEYASAIMRLEPGDVLLAGAPPGVGPVHPGDTVDVDITGIGAMSIPVIGDTGNDG